MLSSLRLPNLNKVRIDDALWSHYTDMVAEIIVPYQWDILNDRVPGELQGGLQQPVESHCIRNFRIAAGELEGEHKGVVFVDTDVYKWLETVAYCLHSGRSKEFESIADEVIDLIGRAQQADGYLNTYYIIKEPDARWSNLVEGHELYSAGHLIEAAVAYYQATGKDKLLNIARRFADLICSVFGPGEGQLKGYPGHQEIELALVKLYRVTNEKRYLDCAKFFIDQRGTEPNYFKAEIEKRGGHTIFREFSNYDPAYAQAHMPVRQQKTAEGHAVRAMYMYSAMADLAAEYGDEVLLDACRTLWNNVTRRRMYITGGIGSSGELERFTMDYHLPNDSGYCETCASIGLALFGRRMALIERDAAYYDVAERALYNRVLAGISTDGQRYFYASPLEVWPDACMDGTSLKHVKPVRQRWFTVACCPTNLARTLASLGQYIYAQSDDTVYINLFVSSSFDAAVGGSRAVLTMKSQLVQQGKADIIVSSESHLPFSLAIRIPDYADKPAFLLDGKAIRPDVKNGYAIISGDFSGEHIISADFHVKPQWVAADPYVRADAGKIALTKGPCVYCLEETDNGGNLAAVFAEPGAGVEESAITDLPGSLPALIYEGKRLSRAGWNGKLYDRAHFELESVRLRAVPYGLWGNREPGEMIVWQNALISKD
jgi:DUF1680 family protein